MATKWNPADKAAGMGLSNGDLTAEYTNPGSVDRGMVRALDALPATGKFYWEITADESTFTHFGIASLAHVLSASSSLVGQSTSGIGFSSVGKKWRNGTGPTNYGNAPTVADTDVVGIAVDLDNDAVWFSVNNSWIDGNGADSSSTVKSEIEAGDTSSAAYSTVLAGVTWYPAFSATDISSIKGKGTANFGANANAPAGFQEIQAVNFTWNPADKSASLTLSEGNLQAAADGAAHRLVRSEFTIASLKYYWEIEIISNDGPNFEVTVGLSDGTHDLDTQLGEDGTDDGYGYASDAFRHSLGTDNAYGPTLGAGAVFGVAYNADIEAVWFSKNGVWIDVNGVANSATVKAAIEAGTTTHAAFTSMTDDLYAALSGRDATAKANFGQAVFKHAVPTGFQALATLSESEGSIDATLPMLTFEGFGYQFISGVINATLPFPQAALIGSSPFLEQTHVATWDMLLEAQHQITWAFGSLEASHQALWDLSIEASQQFLWALMHPVEGAHVALWSSTTEVEAAHQVRWSLLTDTPVEASSIAVWDLLATQVVSVANVPVVTVGGQTVRLTSASVHQDEGGVHWNATLGIAHPASLTLFSRDKAFTLTILGEAYSLIVDSVSTSRRGADVEMTVQAVSPSALLGPPRANRVSQTFASPILASSAADSLAGAAVDWQVLDWTIPANRLSVIDATPLEAVQLLAEAIGATVEAKKDGSLRVRSLYPVSPPSYAGAAVGHTYTDATDNLAVTEGFASNKVYDRVVVRDATEEDEDDRIEFVPVGDQGVRGFLRVYPRPFRGVVVTHTGQSSVGLTDNGVQTRTEVEEIEVFDGRGHVTYPIEQILSVVWMYQNLGSLTHELRGTEVLATGGDNSLARVTYTTRARVYDARHQVAESVQFLVSDA